MEFNVKSSLSQVATPKGFLRHGGFARIFFSSIRNYFQVPEGNKK